MTSTKPTYEIVGFEWIPANKLTPHPNAEMPIDADDRDFLKESIQESTVYSPLLVSSLLTDGQHMILDGLNRWNIVRAATPGAKLPCMLVKCGDVRAVVAACMTAKRKCSTGQRIMVYLEYHADEVLAAYSINAGKGETFRKTHSMFSLESMENEKGTGFWDSRAIATRLHCSQEDVLSGIELLRSLRNPSVQTGSDPADSNKKVEAYRAQRLRILSGSVGIRRWRSAVGGKAATEGKNRADPKHDQLAYSSAVTLKNCFDCWGEIPWKAPYPGRRPTDPLVDDRADAEKAVCAVLSHVPDQFRHFQRDHIVENWTRAQRRQLLKMLEVKAEEDAEEDKRK